MFPMHARLIFVCFVGLFSANLQTLSFAEDFVATNLLPNPSFELANPAPWKSKAWHGEMNAKWSIETPGIIGKQCLAIRSQRGADAAWTTSVTVKPHSFYRLAGWIKTKGLQGATGALLNIQNMQHVKTHAVKGNKDWTRVSTIFRSGETTTLQINCLFGGWGDATGEAWFDDISLEQTTELSQTAHAIVIVDVKTPVTPYSPMLFGGFLEHFDGQIYGGIFEPGSSLADEKGFRKDVIAALKELKLSVVRWPGGCFASGYHWKDGVGTFRKPVYDVVWGSEDPNSFGTDEFLEWCRKVGCEPYICTNAGNGTPEEMKEWVEYCNRPMQHGPAQSSAESSIRPLHVHYWSIGNENWGSHEIGARTPQEWGPLVLRSAELMRSVDPGIKLVAAATPNREWTLPLLTAAGNHLDYLAIHEYWLPCWGENLTPDYLSCITLSEGPETTINRVIDLLDESGHRSHIKVAFDEWNLRSWHHPGFPRKEVSNNKDPEIIKLIDARNKNAAASQYTMADALFSASFLNACLRHADDVGMANIAPIVNTRGPLFVHPKGVVKRTTFHVLSMYANLLCDQVAKAEVASIPLEHAGRTVPALDAIATCDTALKKWRVVLINRSDRESLTCVVKLGERMLRGEHRATVLVGDSPSAYNDIDHPTRVTPQAITLSFKDGQVTLAPHSVTILEVE